MKKILTVVVPTYNMEALLGKCLSSLVVNDNLDLLEVLVINDGSKDGSSDIARGFQDKYPETFRVIDKENGNYGSCINRGLIEATGKYIKILDADDSFDTSSLDKYLAYLSSQDVDLILTDWCIVDSDGTITYTYHYPFFTQKVYSLADMNVPMDFRMHGLTYKVECLRKISYYQTEGISYTDSEWCYMPMSSVKTIAYFANVVYKYLVGRDGQTVEPAVHAKKYWMEVDILKRMIVQYVENKPNWSNEVCHFMQNSLMGRVRIVYEKVLVEFYGCYPMDKFEELDKMLLSSVPDCLHRTNNFIIYKKFPIHYVKVWRKHYDPKEIKLKILRKFYLLKRRCRRC